MEILIGCLIGLIIGMVFLFGVVYTVSSMTGELKKRTMVDTGTEHGWIDIEKNGKKGGIIL